ncbi:MAG TPA: hypothetical protein VGC81_15850 [Candidatus Methylomirabilis sp.]
MRGRTKPCGYRPAVVPGLWVEHSATDAPTYVLFTNQFMGEDALRFQKLLAQPTLRLVRPARQRRA